MENILLLIMGIFTAAVGLVNMSGNISTIHSYNRKNVREEDASRYGKAIGTGTFIIGASLIASFLVLTVWNQEAETLILVPAVVLGLAFIIYGQIKYNKSLF